MRNRSSSKKNSIPLVDLKAQYRALRGDLQQALRTVFERGQFIQGPEVETFERELAAYCGSPHAVAVASGTDALELSLRAMGIGPGDEVIVPAFTFMATAMAVLLAGAKPVFADVEPQTYTIDPDEVAKGISPKTKAILPVHLFGHPTRMPEILSIAKAKGLCVIEDCAQAIGATLAGKKVGTFSQAGAFSFYPSKNLGAYGDGGAVVVRDARLAQQIRELRWYGTPDRLTSHRLGRNSRLDELQAAALRVKLRHLNRWNQARRRHAQTYGSAFRRLKQPAIRPPVCREGCEHVYHLYTVGLPNRNRVQSALVSQGIGAQIYYDKVLPDHPLFSPFASDAPFPVARRLAGELLALPLYPELTSQQIQHVVGALTQALGDQRPQQGVFSVPS